MSKSKIAPMVVTKFLGPTNYRGARVKATHVTTLDSVTTNWDHGLDVSDNHEIAAAELMGKEPTYRASTDSGYIFAFTR